MPSMPTSSNELQDQSAVQQGHLEQMQKYGNASCALNTSKTSQIKYVKLSLSSLENSAAQLLTLITSKLTLLGVSYPGVSYPGVRPIGVGEP